MSSSKKRAVVLGADIDGLAAAAILAQAGLEVHLVDRQEDIGGTARAYEFHPGYTAPGLLHETCLVRRDLLGQLGLEEHGLSWSSEDRPVHVCRGDGELLTIGHAAIGSGPDVEAYKKWRSYIDKLTPLIVNVLDSVPPEASEPSLMDKLGLAKMGLKLRKLGEADMMELLRIVTMPAWDWMEECFEDAALRSGLTALVLPGTVVGPRAAGTTAMMLMREAARGREPVGGLAAVAAALHTCCTQLGVKFHLGVGPRRILVNHAEDPVASGVELTSGESIEAEIVLSALDPKTSLLDLVQPGLIPHHIEDQLKTWRMRGSSAIYLLALSKATGLPGGAERLLTATSPLELERCADALKYGELPESPWLDVRDWSRSESACAPAGCATLSVHVHGVPYELRDGWTGAAREQLREKILLALEKVVPGIRDSLVADELLTPVELEDRFGLRGGQISGGEQVLDQLWVQRPCLALSRYASPIAGLFLGGAGNHPGGAFVGGAGVLSARRALGR